MRIVVPRLAIDEHGAQAESEHDHRHASNDHSEHPGVRVERSAAVARQGGSVETEEVHAAKCEGEQPDAAPQGGRPIELPIGGERRRAKARPEADGGRN